MKIKRTNSFLKDYRTLSSEIQAQVDKQLSLLLENPRHPSLMLKKLKGTDTLEIRASKGYRLTIRHESSVLELRRVGTNNLLQKER